MWWPPSWHAHAHAQRSLARAPARASTRSVEWTHRLAAQYLWDSSGGGYPYGHLSKKASAAESSPVTFHHLTVDQLALYNRMQLVEERGSSGELYRYDFSGHFLKEYIYSSETFDRRFRVLFGISFEVSTHAPMHARRHETAHRLALISS